MGVAFPTLLRASFLYGLRERNAQLSLSFGKTLKDVIANIQHCNVFNVFWGGCGNLDNLCLEVASPKCTMVLYNALLRLYNDTK